MAYQSRVKTWIAGEILYASDLNAEFDAILATLIPEPDSEAQGDILYRGSSTWSRLGKGTGLQIFRMNVGATAPEWVDPTLANWTLVQSTAYTATPASTSTITMVEDWTAQITVGNGLRYTIGGTEYFGVVAAIAANLLTIRGATLGGAVSNLQFGGKVHELVIPINGFYEDATNTALILSDAGYQLTWYKQKSYCVMYKMYSRVKDTSSDGKATFLINGVDLCTSAGGLTIAASATTYSTVVDINTAAYDINLGEPIEISVTKGTTGDATDLTAYLIVVEP